MRLVLLFLVIASLALGCSSSRDSVHEARFQKRQHLRGWQLDLSARRHPIALQRTHLRMLTPRASLEARITPVAERELFAAHEPAPVLVLAPHRAPVQAPRVPTVTEDQALDSFPERDREEEDENIMPRKRWNWLAIPAFLAALGTIVLGFSTNLWALIGAIVLTLVLAGWSIARIRRRNQAGKGFAMAALMIGVFAAVLTAIAVIRYGIDP
ncbi:MAG: DUF4190 domain-containing protein [Flavobacteriales bacterium]